MFLLSLFKMTVNQIELSGIEKKLVINILVTAKCKLCEYYRRTYNVYGRAYFIKKVF